MELLRCEDVKYAKLVFTCAVSPCYHTYFTACIGHMILHMFLLLCALAVFIYIYSQFAIYIIEDSHGYSKCMCLRQVPAGGTCCSPQGS